MTAEPTEPRRKLLRAVRGARDAGPGHQPPDPLDQLRKWEDEVFGATERLGHLRQAARSRMVSPWAVLGCSLMRVTAEEFPDLVVPPFIGAAASLNQYVALVGSSGTGKSAAKSVMDELLDLGDDPTAELSGAGTGEGIMELFLEWNKDQKAFELVPYPNAMVFLDEIATYATIINRTGSSLGEVLRSAWSGQMLSTQNADRTRRRKVPAGAYRLTLVAGVQPELAKVLLDDRHAGTPQRWIWLPAEDPLIPELDELPEWPGQITIDSQWAHGEVKFPEHVGDTVRKAHRERVRGGDDTLDGHRMLARMKLAAPLSLLHDDYRVTEQYWDLSGTLMQLSDATRESCEKAISRASKQDIDNAGRAEGLKQSVANEVLEQARMRKATEALLRGMRAHADGGGSGYAHADGEKRCTQRCLSTHLRHYTGLDKDEVVERATEKGLIETDGRFWWTKR